MVIEKKYPWQKSASDVTKLALWTKTCKKQSWIVPSYEVHIDWKNQKQLDHHIKHRETLFETTEKDQNGILKQPQCRIYNQNFEKP